MQHKSDQQTLNFRKEEENSLGQLKESKKSPKASGAASTSTLKRAQFKSEVGRPGHLAWLTSEIFLFPIVLVHIVSQQISLSHFRF